KEARGNILAYLDDDVVLAPSWRDPLKNAFRDPSIALLSGPSIPYYEVQPPAWLDGLWIQTEQGRILGALSLIDEGSSIRKTDRVGGLNFTVGKTAVSRRW